MQIVGLVNGNSNNSDFQFQTAASSLLNQGTIAGLEVTTNQVAVGSALISVTSNGQTWLITYHNTSIVTIDTSGTKKVWIDVTQSKIDNGVANNEDGTGIAQINTGASYPGSGSYIPLASITGGVITDERVFVSMKNVKRKGMTAHRLIYIDASGNESELPYGTAGQVLTAVNGTTTPIWSSPSVDINALTNKTTPVGGDYTIITDSEASFVNKKIDLKTLMQDIGGNGSDGALTISTGTTTIPFTSDGVVEKNYTTLTITGGKLTFSGPLTNGSIAVIKCHKLVMSGGEISVSGMGGDHASQGFNANKILTTNQGATYTYSGGVGVGNMWLMSKFCGAGGGGGKKYSNTLASLGGRGGGILLIEARSFDFSGGVLSSNGLDGGSSGGFGAGAGGGGGGTILITARNIINTTGTIQVNGGNGSAGAGSGGYNDNMQSGGGGGSYSSGGSGGNSFGNGSAGASNSWGSGGNGGIGVASGGSGGGGGGAGFYKIN